jgi:hypothetical protein
MRFFSQRNLEDTELHRFTAHRGSERFVGIHFSASTMGGLFTTTIAGMARERNDFVAQRTTTCTVHHSAHNEVQGRAPKSATRRQKCMSLLIYYCSTCSVKDLPSIGKESRRAVSGVNSHWTVECSQNAAVGLSRRVIALCTSTDSSTQATHATLLWCPELGPTRAVGFWAMGQFRFPSIVGTSCNRPFSVLQASEGKKMKGKMMRSTEYGKGMVCGPRQTWYGVILLQGLGTADIEARLGGEFAIELKETRSSTQKNSAQYTL